MADSPVRHIGEDGSVYAAEIVPPEVGSYDARYHVDLVRASVDRYGLEHEQRLTLGQYRSWGEAEEHQREVEGVLAERGLEGLGENARRVAQMPYEDGDYLAAVFPIDAQPGHEARAHLLFIGGDQIAAMPVARGSFEQMDALVSRIDAAWIEGGNEQMLEIADQKARGVTDSHPAVDYYFGYGVGPSNFPSLEVVKTWMDGSERRFDTLTVAEYGMWDEAQADERELEGVMQGQGIEAALNLAERRAAANGYLDPNRDDPRVFFQDGAPPDPFTTIRERELVEGMALTPDEIDDMDTEPLRPVRFGLEPSIKELRDEITRRGGIPLEPLNPHVNYTFEIVAGEEPDAAELKAEKWWREPEGEWGSQTLAVNRYTDEGAAYRDYMAAYHLNETLGLEAAMRFAESLATASGQLDPARADPRLFTQGPPDRFETLAQRLEGEVNPYWNTAGEQIADPAPEGEVENPYWRLDTLPVNDLAGEPLGHGLHMVVYPGVERDPEQVGAPHIPKDEPFRMLEMAHFETAEAADKFGKEFNGYLVPGLLEGPELAQEVARLEGLPVAWKTVEGQELEDYHDLKLTLTRDRADWHPYNPNAERDARIEAEGLYTDPIQQSVERDEPQPEVVTPDFDL